jgi:hypothetical protein
MSRVRKVGSRYLLEIATTVDVGKVDVDVEIDVGEELGDMIDMVAVERPQMMGEILGQVDADPRLIVGFIREAKRFVGSWEHEVKPMLLEAIES